MKLGLLATGSLLVFAATSPARAQDRADAANGASARAALDDGAAVPLAIPAAGLKAAPVVKFRAGFDGASHGADLRGEVSAPILGPLVVRAGAAYDALGKAVEPFVLAHVSLLEQADSFVDVAVTGGFEARTFNTERGVLLGVAVSRRFGPLLLLNDVYYSHSLTSEERSGGTSVAAMLRAAEHLQVGVDSLAQVDLERDDIEPLREPDWRVLGGPFTTLSLGSFALSAGGGASALRYRLTPSSAVGAFGYLGISAFY
jgi:hypothetical protein